MCFDWEPNFCSERRKKIFTSNVFEVVQSIFWKSTRIMNLFDYSVSVCRAKYGSLITIRSAIYVPMVSIRRAMHHTNHTLQASMVKYQFSTAPVKVSKLSKLKSQIIKKNVQPYVASCMENVLF